MRLQVRCRLSTSFRCPSLISTAYNVAVGALPALHIVPTHVFHLTTSFRYASSISTACNAATGALPSFLPRSDVCLPFQPLARWLEVCCQLSTSFKCVTPILTARNTTTGSLQALYLVPTRVSHFNRLQYGDMCITQLSTSF